MVTAAPISQKEASPPGSAKPALADWMTEHYTASAPGRVMTEGLSSVMQTCSTVTAFLLGAAAVPLEVLTKVSPVMLAKLFQHLGDGAMPSQSGHQVCAHLCSCSTFSLSACLALEHPEVQSKRILGRCSSSDVGSTSLCLSGLILIAKMRAELSTDRLGGSSLAGLMKLPAVLLAASRCSFFCLIVGLLHNCLLC